MHTLDVNDTERAKARLDIVEGVLRALRDADRVGALIAQSEDRAEARSSLVRDLDYSEIQANHVLDMTFARRTRQAVSELETERDDLVSQLRDLNS